MPLLLQGGLGLERRRPQAAERAKDPKASSRECRDAVMRSSPSAT